MSETSKKLLPLQIYLVLKEHSNKDNPLSQQQIATLLRKNYEVEVNRKTIYRNGVQKKYEGKSRKKFPTMTI